MIVTITSCAPVRALISPVSQPMTAPPTNPPTNADDHCAKNGRLTVVAEPGREDRAADELALPSDV